MGLYSQGLQGATGAAAASGSGEISNMYVTSLVTTYDPPTMSYTRTFTTNANIIEIREAIIHLIKQQILVKLKLIQCLLILIFIW